MHTATNLQPTDTDVLATQPSTTTEHAPQPLSLDVLRHIAGGGPGGSWSEAGPGGSW